MQTEKAAALAVIDEKSAECTFVSDEIWAYAELSLKERRSAALYRDMLEKEGFAVSAGLDGVETAVVGTFGSGRPVIGILAEYDALSGLSQEACKAERLPLTDTDNGHGCGHNLLGAGAFGAALAVKAYLAATGKPGTVVFYGCPGEEGGAAKAFFAKYGEWYKLDAALTWHPDDVNQVCSGSNMACIQTEYRYTGVAAHAAGAPEQGRSALDAVELCNIGVQFLREHMKRSASIHYAVTDGGGLSPNVVQPHAKVLYMVRDATVQDAVALQARVDKIAEAAAMMTETTVHKRFIDGTANPVPNEPLERLLYANFAEIGAPQYTAEEWAFAEALRATYAAQVSGLPGIASACDETLADEIAERTDGGKRALNDFLMPFCHTSVTFPGSTDVGDVSWQTPTAQINCVTTASGTPGHSWQNVSAGKSTIAHKGMLTAAKVLAAAAIDLIADPSLLAPAKAYFDKAAAAGYCCPIPDGAKPEIV